MKQIFVYTAATYPTKPTNVKDLNSDASNTIPEGAIMLFDLKTGNVLSAKAEDNFQLIQGRGNNILPFVFPEIDVKSLTVQKSGYTAATNFASTITVPETTVANKNYTIVVVKNGTVFNERNKWTFTARAKNVTDSADVATELRRQINALINVGNDTLGVKAEGTGAAVVIKALNAGDDYTVIGADELMGTSVTSHTVGAKAINDGAYIADLVQRCVADKGVKYLGEDGAEIYPGYPENVPEAEYVLYTLRFAVPRVAAKQRDEVVYQTVQIAVDSSKTAITGKFDTILGLSVPAGTSETGQ